MSECSGEAAGGATADTEECLDERHKPGAAGNWRTFSLPSAPQYCVYTHSYKGTVFYVGKGLLSRPWEQRTRREFWKKYVAALEGPYDITVIFLTHDETQALTMERALIRMWQPRCNTQWRDGTPFAYVDSLTDMPPRPPAEVSLPPPSYESLTVQIPEPVIDLLAVLADSQGLRRDHLVERAITEYLGKAFAGPVEVVSLLTQQALRLSCLDMKETTRRLGLLETAFGKLVRQLGGGENTERVSLKLLCLLDPDDPTMLRLLTWAVQCQKSSWRSGLSLGIFLGVLSTAATLFFWK